ncbi:hypothetical protein DJ021_15430 [Phenylobacterium hankyongense]|uniref:BON domain-containing protein n=1 Tax=Phenylobacterium hankyongense TaxID=1813876 RepID=A0A328B3Z1_9CAUL|nr:BON domain-containing protein [Phenylobacterium hankyongense]RAK61101.1 hypothetical protein DJ021_15430 [Phenylobacterium hankyongense]
MPREDWTRGEPPRTDDFGQADYSTDYGYDPRRRVGYRAEDDVARDDAYDAERGRAYRPLSEDDPEYARRMNSGEYRGGEPARDGGRSWMNRAGDFFAGRTDRDEDRPPPRRRGPSDRVLWAVIVERLEDERRLDLRDVDVIVDNAEVTLNGTVRRKEDKRRIEDIADIDGVRHVQNNLRVRDRGWTFI